MAKRFELSVFQPGFDRAKVLHVADFAQSVAEAERKARGLAKAWGSVVIVRDMDMRTENQPDGREYRLGMGGDFDLRSEIKEARREMKARRA